MKYNFDEIIDRRGTGSLKWDNREMVIKMGFAEKFDDDTLPLFIADMDIAVPPAIVEAMHKTADNRIYGYSMPVPEYFDAIIGWFNRRHGWKIEKQEILYSPGTVHAIGVAVRAFTQPGEGVIIQRPVYFPFTREILNNGRVVANNQMLLDTEGNYSINFSEFEQLAAKPENKLFILCNPHNPTGRIFSDDDLIKIAKICRENDVVIMADEIHGDLIRKDKKFTPIAKLAEKDDNIVTCTAINKTFNTAGLHASAIVIKDDKLRSAYRKEMGIKMPTPFTYNAVIAAYNECEDWLEEIKGYFDETFDWVLDFLNEKMPKVRCVRPEGTYILWMDFRGYGISAAEIKKRIYKDANVILESGSMYDPDAGDGFERICLSSPRKIVMEAFERIAAAFEDIC